MKKHILLVDEDQENLQILKTALNEVEAPFKCTYLTNCDHASKVLEYVPVDVMMINLEPHVSDSLEFLRLAKRSRTLRKVPIVVYCRNMSYYNHLARGYGADHCMNQPENAAMIQQALAHVIRGFETAT